jgi:transcriptional/translational regulatory protein YebC/TACO1
VEDMKTIQEMAQKATGATGTLLTCSLVGIKEIEAFDALVREDERQIIIAKNAPEIKRVNEHLKNLGRQVARYPLRLKASVALAREEERERIAKLVDDIEARCIGKDVDDPPLSHVAAAIRARNNT